MEKRVKPLTELTKHLKEVRQNQPRVSYAEALAQALKVMKAANPKNEPKVVPFHKWETLLRTCVNAEADRDFVQDKLEEANLKIADRDEQVTRLAKDYTELSQDHQKLAAEFQYIKLQHTAAMAERERIIAKLTRDLETCEGNRKYACDHIQEQNKLIREAKITTDTLREQNSALEKEIALLKAERVNNEHLAKKSIQLHNENEQLKSIRDAHACPFQRTKDSIHIRCGKCTSCKLEAAEGIIDRITSNVERVENDLQKVEDELTMKKAILTQTIENLAKANKDREVVEYNFSNSLEEGERLRKENERLQTTVGHQEKMMEIMQRDLRSISKGLFWHHATVAKKSLEEVTKYKANIEIL